MKAPALKVLLVRVPAQLHKKLKLKAAREGATIQGIVVNAVAREVREAR